MTKEEQILCKHLKDLADACYYRDCATFSDFLNLNEQSIFLSMANELSPITYQMDGGYPLAERKRVCFSPVGVGFLIPTPLCVLKIKPRNVKFAETLSHRDYLGAILNLGISRGKIGDIVMEEKECTVICTEEIGNYVVENLTKVKHTMVFCEQIDIQQIHYQPKFQEIRGSIASPRLDAIIGLAFHHSRTKMSSLIASEKVFVNGKLITSNSYQLKEDDIVSVRGLGKFIYEGMQNQTKKGRYFVSLKLFC